jgi:hypothetical protein
MAPARRRLAVLSAAFVVLAAVLAVMLPGGTASAETSAAARTRVWAISFTPQDRVGADRPVSAGERQGEPRVCPFYAPGSCVAAEEGSVAINTSRDLGMDPATGSFRQGEYDTALRIQQERDVVLQRSADPGVDWVDTEGNTYDAVGNFSSKYFDQQWSNLQTRILDHMEKANFVPVDVSGFTEPQIGRYSSSSNR